MRKIAADKNYNFRKQARPSGGGGAEGPSPTSGDENQPPGVGFGGTPPQRPNRRKPIQMADITGGIIKDQASGNAFRAWLRKNHPNKARQLKIDQTGSWNNMFMARAWKEMGEEYTKTYTQPRSPKAGRIRKKIEQYRNEIKKLEQKLRQMGEMA
tara:strand:- start:661 stop:1125 length:465 start_codon:yes stop_codon:yes gene_type:complete